KEFIDRYINTIKNYNYEVKLNDILIVISNYLSEDKNKLYVNINSFKLDILEQVDIKRLLDDYYINYIPLEYITNKKEFFKEKFYINNTVLIPRSDSELLVEVAIKYITENKLKSCLDMCSGSGAIGISIANNCNISNVDLVDIIDPFVLKMNKNNLDRYYKCNILTSDLFTNLTNKYDIIVSNPPYIQTNVIDTLTEYVKAEPLIALDGKEDGIYFYDQILSKANMYLNDDAYVIFEIGYDLNDKVIELINKYNFEYIETLKDINNLDRVIVCHFVKK
ncbi:MAG: peptide chain release factor N(5)-glutamine methyltransferase, partial [Clostridia bacterium]